MGKGVLRADTAGEAGDLTSRREETGRTAAKGHTEAPRPRPRLGEGVGGCSPGAWPLDGQELSLEPIVLPFQALAPWGTVTVPVASQ